MIQVRNLNKKLVCKIREDGLCVEIVRGDCLTRILLSPGGQFSIEHKKLPE